MTSAGFFEQWEEGNMALGSPESYFMGTPDWNEESGKMCSLERDEWWH